MNVRCPAYWWWLCSQTTRTTNEADGSVEEREYDGLDRLTKLTHKDSGDNTIFEIEYDLSIDSRDFMTLASSAAIIATFDPSHRLLTRILDDKSEVMDGLAPDIFRLIGHEAGLKPAAVAFICRSSAVFGQQQVEIKRDLEWC